MRWCSLKKKEWKEAIDLVRGLAPGQAKRRETKDQGGFTALQFLLTSHEPHLWWDLTVQKNGL
jgi:hypothetical protein